jgi:hypothetical protein
MLSLYPMEMAHSTMPPAPVFYDINGIIGD